MVTLKGPMNTQPAAPTATLGGQQNNNAGGFSALFAALQAHANGHATAANDGAQNAALSALQLTDAAAKKLAQELPELSPEALQQLLAQLEQANEQATSDNTALAQHYAAAATVLAAQTAAASAAPAETTSTPAVTTGNAVATTLAAAATAVNSAAPKATSKPETSVPTAPVKQPLEGAQRSDAQRDTFAAASTALINANNQQSTDARNPLNTGALNTQAPVEAPRLAGNATTTPMTASIVMIDAPVATPSTTAATATQAPPPAALTAQVGSSAWANQLQQNVLQMVMHNQNEMTLRLHPAELGPLQVQLRLDDQAAQLNILTHSNQVRGALEQALPMLRDALANQGIQLGDSQVNDNAQQFAQQQERQQAQQWAKNGQDNANNTVENLDSAENTDMGSDSRHTAASPNSQVDTYA